MWPQASACGVGSKCGSRTPQTRSRPQAEACGYSGGLKRRGVAILIINRTPQYFMPAGSPFTQLCQQLARPRAHGRADLHLHTTFSDGLYTPAQVVDLGRRSGLAAIAITDHDTFGGLAEARRAAGQSLEVIAGVEITCELLGRELHLLGYFFDPENGALNEALKEMQAARHERFLGLLERLRTKGVDLVVGGGEGHGAGVEGPATAESSLGRRHVAELLVAQGHADTIQHAFQRYLRDGGPIAVSKRRLPVAHAIELIREAGGVSSWAHPPFDQACEHLTRLKEMGLGAVEAHFPSCRPGHVRELKSMAQGLGLAITGGSDCHGPEPLRRAVGSFGIGHVELERLRIRS